MVPTSHMRVTASHTIYLTDTTKALLHNYLPKQRKPSPFLPNNLQNDPVFVLSNFFLCLKIIMEYI